MYEVKESNFVPDNFHCGDFPVVTGFGVIKEGAKVRRHAPVVLGEDGLAELTAEMLNNSVAITVDDSETDDNEVTTETTETTETSNKLVGISADEPDAGGNIVYYQTGAFRAESVVLPEGVTIEALAAACRPLNIFLK